MDTEVKAVDVLSFLLGAWQLERAIDDRRAGTQGTFRGEARFCAVDRGASMPPQIVEYREAGRLRFGSYSGPAQRALRYERSIESSVLVSFADGRPFVELDLAGGTCACVHDCGGDRYEITVTVISPNVVEERWDVRGPAKDYTAVGRLTRC